MAATGLYDEDGSYRVTVVGNDATGTSAEQVQGNVADDAPNTGNPVLVGGVYNNSPVAHAVGDRTQFLTGPYGSLAVANGNSGTGTDGYSNTLAFTVGLNDNLGARLNAEATFIFNGTTWDRLVKPNATSRIASSAASVNATSAKASAGNVFRIFGNNAKASIVYLKIYNKATAPTVGTDVPVLTIPIAASSRFDIDIGGANGFYLGTGIAYGFTTDAADNGTTALLAADILGFTLTYS